VKAFKYKYEWSERDDWFVPDDEEMMQGQFPILDEQIDFVLGAIEHAKGMNDSNVHFRTCVQAGGAFGLYPLRLADYFEKVWTFEPLLANLQCMAANIGPTHPNMTIATNALWHEAAKLHMSYSKPKKNSYGAHHITTSGKGETVAAYPLDDWTLEEVDLLWLDIEGAEVYALMGAANTIRRCKPVIVIEEAKHLPQHRDLGVRLDSASHWLKRNGYREWGRTHGDLVFIPYDIFQDIRARAW
jgi:FkbM family methyltransferase